MSIHLMGSYAKPGGLVVRVLRCGCSEPGSNTGLDIQLFAKQIFGRGSTKTDHKETTDASHIQKKNSTEGSTKCRSKKT